MEKGKFWAKNIDSSFLSFFFSNTKHKTFIFLQILPSLRSDNFKLLPLFFFLAQLFLKSFNYLHHGEFMRATERFVVRHRQVLKGT